MTLDGCRFAGLTPGFTARPRRQRGDDQGDRGIGPPPADCSVKPQPGQDEVTAHALARPTYRRLFDHPSEDRFSAEEFLDELTRSGLVVLGSVPRVRGDYLLGVAAKPDSGGTDR